MMDTPEGPPGTTNPRPSARATGSTGHWICQLSEAGLALAESATGYRPGFPATKVLMHADAAPERVRELALDLLVFHQLPPMKPTRRARLLEQLSRAECISCRFVGHEARN